MKSTPAQNNYEYEYGENVSVNDRLIDLGYEEFPPDEENENTINNCSKFNLPDSGAL